MTDTEFDTYVKATKATVRRLTAENTWLRHSLLELKHRVDDMKAQMADLETRAKAMKKSLVVPPTKTETKSRSKT